MWAFMQQIRHCDTPSISQQIIVIRHNLGNSSCRLLQQSMSPSFFSYHDQKNASITSLRHFTTSSHQYDHTFGAQSSTTYRPFNVQPLLQKSVEKWFEKSGLRKVVREIWFEKSGLRKVVDQKKRWFYTINPHFFRLEKSG